MAKDKKKKVIILKKQTPASVPAAKKKTPAKKPATKPKDKTKTKAKPNSAKNKAVRNSNKPGSRIDWSIIKQAYVTDPKATTRGLEKQFGVSRSAIATHCKNENWTKERQDWLKKTESNALEAAGESRQAQIQALNERHTTLFKDISDKLAAATEGLSMDEWAAKNLESLARAAKHVMEAERLIIGLPSEVKGLSDPRGERLTVTIESLHQKAKQVLDGKQTDNS